MTFVPKDKIKFNESIMRL